MTCASESLRAPTRLRISLSFLLFISVKECATAYFGLIDENFAVAGIRRVGEGERVEADGGRH
jgi:hypothetical protein